LPQPNSKISGVVKEDGAAGAEEADLEVVSAEEGQGAVEVDLEEVEEGEGDSKEAPEEEAGEAIKGDCKETPEAAEGACKNHLPFMGWSRRFSKPSAKISFEEG
jgi:hypothetical protein